MIKSCKIGGIDIIKSFIDIQGLKTTDSRDLESLHITINDGDMDIFKELIINNQSNACSFELINSDKQGEFTYRFVGEVKFIDVSLINVNKYFGVYKEAAQYLIKYEYSKMILTDKEE